MSAGQQTDRTSASEETAEPVRIAIRVAVDYATRAELERAFAANEGPSGTLYVPIEHALSPGGVLELLIACPWLPQPVLCEARVVGRVTRNETRVPLTQMAVVRWAAGDRERLTDFLAGVAAAPSVPKATHVEARIPSAPRGLDVLLVEDNEFVSRLFTHAIKRFELEHQADGFRFATADSGVEALRILESAPKNLVILDHYLPGLNGCDLLRRLRAMSAYESVPILMISAGGEEVRREALAAGATEYIEKPVRLVELLDTLRRLAPRASEA